MIGAGQHPFLRYEVNVFVAHDSDGGAPVVVETNPTYPNLFGRIEHQGVLAGDSSPITECSAPARFTAPTAAT